MILSPQISFDPIDCCRVYDLNAIYDSTILPE